MSMPKTKANRVKDKVEKLGEEIAGIKEKIQGEKDELASVLSQADPDEERVEKLQNKRDTLKGKLSQKKEQKQILEDNMDSFEKETARGQLNQCKGKARDTLAKANELRDEYLKKQKSALEAGRKWRSVVDEATDLRGKCHYLAAKADVSGPNISKPKQVDDNPDISLDEWFNELRKITGEVWGKSSWDKKIQRLRRSNSG